MKQKRSILAFTSFILGLASVVPYIGVPFALLAIILGIVALIRIKSTYESGGSLAKWGIAFAIVWRVAWPFIFGSIGITGGEDSLFWFLF